MNSQPAPEAFPLDLGYLDPVPAQLDLTTIVSRGRRIRRWRRLAQVAATVAACAVLATVVVGGRGVTAGWFQGAAGRGASRAHTPIDSTVDLQPPVTGKLTLVSNWPQHWTTVAWGTRAGDVCWAMYRTPAESGAQESDCWSRSDLPGEGAHGLSSLTPSMVPATFSLVPELGLVTPRAATVTVTFFGHPFHAGVVPVPLGDGRSIGVYLIWLRLPPGASSYGSGDVAGAVAYDQAGHLVARHGPGM